MDSYYTTNYEVKKPNIKNFTCKLCCEIMVEPIKLPCGHKFCLWCVKSRIELQRRCSKCKDNIEDLSRQNLNIYKPTQKKAEKHYPFEFRKQKLVLMKSEKYIGDKVPLKFSYGNYHKILERDDFTGSKNTRKQHEFIMFFELSQFEEQTQKIIKSIDYVLKIPRLKNPVYSIKDYPFTYKNKTFWECLEAKIVVNFHHWTGLACRIINWPINLANNGNKKDQEILIEKDLLLENDIPKYFIHEISNTKNDEKIDKNAFNLRSSHSNFRRVFGQSPGSFLEKTGKIETKKQHYTDDNLRHSTTGINFILYRSTSNFSKKPNLFKIK